MNSRSFEFASLSPNSLIAIAGARSKLSPPAPPLDFDIRSPHCPPPQPPPPLTSLESRRLAPRRPAPRRASSGDPRADLSRSRAPASRSSGPLPTPPALNPNSRCARLFSAPKLDCPALSARALRRAISGTIARAPSARLLLLNAAALSGAAISPIGIIFMHRYYP